MPACTVLLFCYSWFDYLLSGDDSCSKGILITSKVYVCVEDKDGHRSSLYVLSPVTSGRLIIKTVHVHPHLMNKVTQQLFSSNILSDLQ